MQGCPKPCPFWKQQLCAIRGTSAPCHGRKWLVTSAGKMKHGAGNLDAVD